MEWEEEKEKKEIISFVKGQSIILTRNSVGDIKLDHKLLAEIGIVERTGIDSYYGAIRYVSSMIPLGGSIRRSESSTRLCGANDNDMMGALNARNLCIGRLIMEGWTVVK